MNTADPATPRRRYRLRFSLLALFLLMTAVCLLLAWFTQPRQCTVEALFQVDGGPLQLLSEPASIDAEEVHAFRQNKLEILKSQFVVNWLIRNPSNARLPVLASREDPVQWIIDNLEVSYDGHSEILTLRIRGPEDAGDQLQFIVDLVGAAPLASEAVREAMAPIRIRKIIGTTGSSR